MAERKITRRRFLGTTAATLGLAAVYGTGCATLSRMMPLKAGDGPYVARLRVRQPSRVRILQMTDLHFFAGKDPVFGLLNPQTTKIMEQLVRLADPDVVIITGDLWRDGPEPRREEFMEFAVEQCEALGVPWAFTWGNHDQMKDFAMGHRRLTEAKNSLYRGAQTDGNYVIDITGPHRKVLSQFLCLNSGVDGLGAPQQAWLRSLPQGAGAPPRFAFFHIPLKQYDTIWQNGSASGFRGEVPCIEKEDGSTLPILKALGVRACFCGHDHSNDYAATIDGVELVYGRATGPGGYGAIKLKKGAKLITLDCKTGKYDWVSLLPDCTRWHPAPGERVERTDSK